MSKKPMAKWETAIKCPFCGAEIVSTYENPRDTGEEDTEDDDWSAGTEVDVWTCPHVAYYGNWGYEEFSATKDWEPEIKAIRAARKLDDMCPYDLAEEARDRVPEFEKSIKKILPRVDVACDHFGMDTGDGPHGDGVAWYFYIFMRRKRSKRSVRR